MTWSTLRGYPDTLPDRQRRRVLDRAAVITGRSRR